MHILCKHKPRYNLQNKMHWHNDFKSFIDKFFCYNSEEKNTKFPNPKMKPNKIHANFLCKDIEKMTSFWKVYTFISILHEMFLISLIVLWYLHMKGRLLANVSNKISDEVFALFSHTCPYPKYFKYRLL